MKFYSTDPLELVVLLTQISDEAIGVLRCFSELRRVSLERDENRLSVVKNSGVARIQQAIYKHRRDPEVLIAGCNLLRALISYQGMYLLDGFSNLVLSRKPRRSDGSRNPNRHC